MSLIKRFLGQFHRTMAQFPLIIWYAVKIRNQASSIIAYSFGEETSPDSNSEGWLIEQVAPISKTFVDVGANVGNWSSLFIKSASGPVKGILFEPSHHTLKVLRENLGNSSNIEIIDKALGEFEGKTFFFDELGMGESSSVIRKSSLPGAAETVVNIATLDNELRHRNWDSVDFLKIDAEGYDLQVMKGAYDLLKQQKIGILQFEYGPGWRYSGSTLTAAIDFLESFGYRVFLLKNNSLLRCDPDFYGEYFAYSNYVAISPLRYSRMFPDIH